MVAGVRTGEATIGVNGVNGARGIRVISSSPLRFVRRGEGCWERNWSREPGRLSWRVDDAGME